MRNIACYTMLFNCQSICDTNPKKYEYTDIFVTTIFLLPPQSLPFFLFSTFFPLLLLIFSLIYLPFLQLIPFLLLLSLSTLENTQDQSRLRQELGLAYTVSLSPFHFPPPLLLSLPIPFPIQVFPFHRFTFFPSLFTSSISIQRAFLSFPATVILYPSHPPTSLLLPIIVNYFPFIPTPKPFYSSPAPILSTSSVSFPLFFLSLLPCTLSAYSSSSPLIPFSLYPSFPFLPPAP